MVLIRAIRIPPLALAGQHLAAVCISFLVALVTKHPAIGDVVPKAGVLAERLDMVDLKSVFRPALGALMAISTKNESSPAVVIVWVERPRHSTS